jgi:hypothetical protein
LALRHTLLQHLGAPAEAALQQPGWAGFWELWLILQARQAWPGSDDHLPPTLAAAVAELPLGRSLKSPAAAKAPNAPSCDWLDPQWHTQLPRWMSKDPKEKPHV